MSLPVTLQQSCNAGIFTPRAEITNARAAMLGFAALLFLENTSNVPFF